jgi:predicted aspartyl protease
MISRRALLAAAPGLAITGIAHAQQTPAPPEGEIAMALDAWTDTFGRPIAKVRLDGKGPFDFMVDTGSTNSVITQRLAIQLASPIVGRARVSGTTGTADMPLAQVSKLETGVVTKAGLAVAVLPGASLGKIDGILGADVFIGKKLSFDIQAKSVTVEDSSRRRYPSANMRLRNGMLAEVDGMIGTIRTRMMLDTGAQYCIVNMPLQRQLERKYPNLRRVNRVKVIGVTGASIYGDYFELPRVMFSKFTVQNSDAVAADAQIFKTWDLEKEAAMIVGVSLLSRLANFSIDYGARQFDGELMADLIAENMVQFS